MSRRRKVVIAICLVAATFGGAVLWALPEVVRRVAVQKIPELTGRATSIEDIDLNLFTGRFAVKKLRMARRPGHGPESFVEFDRLDGRVALLALLRFDVRLVDLRLSRPTVRITRTEPFGFDFSDLLALFVKPVGTEQPSRWTFSLAHLEVSGGTVVVDDTVPSPPQQWRLEEVGIGAAALTTRSNQRAGQLRLAGRLGETKLSVTSESVQLTPFNIGLDVSLSAFDVVRLRPYLPADLPAAPLSGKVDLALHLDRVRAGEALAESSLSGEVRVQGLSLVQRDRAAVFLRLDRLAVAIKRMDFLAQHVVLSGIDVEGLDVKAERSKSGEIDVLDLIAPRRVAAPAGSGGAAEADEQSATVGAETPAAPRGPSSEAKVARVGLERLGLRAGTLTLVDAAVAPAREWKVAGLTIDAASISSAGEDAPGTLRVEGQVETRPGSSKPASFAVDADAVRLSPPSVSASVTLTGFELSALEPYWPQTLPATARQGSVGFALKFGLERTEAGLARAVASGSARVQGVTVARRGSSAPFLTIPRLAVEIKQADAVARQLAIGTVEIAGVALRAVRDARGQIDLLGLVPAGEPGPAVANQLGADSGAVATAPSPAAPSNPPPGTVTVDRLIVRSARIALADEAVSPSREWKIEGLNVDAARLSTSPKDAPGTLRLRAKVAARPSPSSPAALAVDADSLRLAPSTVSARVSLDGFDLDLLRPYWPATLPAVATEGVVGFGARIGVGQGGSGLSHAVASGDFRVQGLAVLQHGAAAPFLKIPRLVIGLRQADALARIVALGTVEVEGADLRAVRDAAGRIDLLGLAPAAEPALEEVKSRTGLNVESPAPPPLPAAPAPSQWRISLDRFAFTKGSLTFEDQDVSPATTLPLTDVRLSAEQVAWPFTQQATFSLAATMPGGGRTDGKGTAVLEPLNVQIALSTRESPIEPYQAYFPFAARLRGRFSGDSLSEIQRGPKGELILASRGTSWASNLDVRAPGVEDPVVSVAAMAINDIDFSWPNYALVQRVILTRPEVRVERDAQGAINLRTLFTPRKNETPRDTREAAAPAEAAARSEPPKEGREGETARSGGEGGMVIDFGEIEVENGGGRFIDHTTTPAFSENITRLALTIKNLSNVLGRPDRTTLSAQALVGVDGALDMRGDLSGIGETLRADLVVELRAFSLPATNPYSESLTSWIVQRGTLEAKLHYRVEGDRITADHELEFKKLRVEKSAASDEAKRRIGVPLGLAVALLRDSNGDIDFKLPLSGTLSDKNFDWGETVWAGVKQVIAKVLLSPFRAVGRLFKGGDDSVDKLEIDPVTFPPGSAVIAPSIEAQLTHLADFLGRSPGIRLALASVLTTADVQRVKEQQVSARLEALRREQRLADLASAIRADYQQRVLDVPLPRTTTDQIALLVSREPVPEAQLAELARRRLEATRDDLVKARGIAEARVMVPAPSPAPAPSASGEGRVEFTIVPE